MKIKQLLFSLTLLISLIGLSTLQAQNNTGKAGDKVIIDGKTYYLHQVDKSEGLYRISLKYGITQREILDANPSITTELTEGQILKIPVISGRNSSTEEIKNEQFIYHTVEKGQTAFFISQKYNVPLETIYKYNVGSKEQLVQGSVIKMPKNQVTQKSVTPTAANDNYIYHTVKPKETIFGLARMYSVEVDDIVDNNPALASGSLEKGSVVRIPQKKNKTNGARSVANLEDGRYIYHRIEVGQTLYSISKQYGIEVSALKAANSNINGDGLVVGNLLLIPKTSQAGGTNQANLFINHTVKKGETLFAISREYNVDIDVITKVNPTTNLSNLKKGEVIQIPNSLWFAKNYNLQDNVNTPAPAKDNTSTTALKENCDGFKGKNSNLSIQVAVLLPFAIEETKKLNASKLSTPSDENRDMKSDKLVSMKSKVFIEFYQGVLLALDSLKKDGVSVDLLVHDISPDTFRLKKLLTSPEMANIDLIIGPAYPNELKVVSDFAKSRNIPVIYPFSQVNTELKNNASIYQMTPVDTLLFDNYAQHLMLNGKGKRIILLRTDASNEYENRLTQVLRNNIYWESFKKGITPDFVEFKYKEGETTGLEAIFKADVENLVLIPSNDEAQVTRLIARLKTATINSKANVTLWGLPEWLKFQTVNIEDVHALNGKIFSYYALDKTNPRTKTIITRYRNWFQTEPVAISPFFQNATVHSNYSRFSLWGYDITYFFVSAINQYGKSFNRCITSHHPYAVQSNFRFKRLNNWSGFYNEGLFIVNFTRDLKVISKPID